MHGNEEKFSQDATESYSNQRAKTDQKGSRERDKSREGMQCQPRRQWARCVSLTGPYMSQLEPNWSWGPVLEPPKLT